ncbi:MAG: radical SAM protein [Candidatus Riflebacteria bacterium]|nr:radical SAM protein [Candidatus Riflebacteria bacterium]
MKKNKFVFGPVPSRRLGRSLGIDITPGKNCTLNCCYCQLHQTLNPTNSRRSFCNYEEVLSELFLSLEEISPSPDWITFSGTGEPTLHSEIGKIISKIKMVSGIPVCVITNGTLLHLPEVREDLSLVEKVMPTLTTLDDVIFQKIHRPASGITLKTTLLGLTEFSKKFRGFLEIEIFLIAGVNDYLENAQKLGSFIKSLHKVDGIYLNTAVRSPSDDTVKAVSPENLLIFKKHLDLGINISTAYELSPLPKISLNPSGELGEERIQALLFRHPCTTKEMAATFGVSVEKIENILAKLHAKKRIKANSDGTWNIA